MSETENNGYDFEGENFPSWKPMSEQEKNVLDSMRATQDEIDQRRFAYKKWRDEIESFGIKTSMMNTNNKEKNIW